MAASLTPFFRSNYYVQREKLPDCTTVILSVLRENFMKVSEGLITYCF